MTTSDFHAELATSDACPGCGDEVVLVTADDGSMGAVCLCSAAVVLVAA